MKKQISRTTFAFITGFAFAAGLANAATITDISGLGGWDGFATGINAAGQVVGYSYPTGSQEIHAFLYTPGVGTTVLGSLGGAFNGGNIASSPNGINASGQVVGGAGNLDDFENAFLYSGGVMMNLGTLTGRPDDKSEATAINASGQVVGWSDSGINRDQHAFLYTPGSGMTDLGTFGNESSPFSAATGINDSGQVVGWSVTADFHSEAFLYTPGSGMTSLGTLPGGLNSSATAINASGQVVGTSDDESGTGTAFLYTPGSGMISLGTLGLESVPTGINAYGRIVGWSNTADGQVPFLYSNGTMINLNSLLPGGSDWTLESAAGINDSGQIVGYGLNPEGQTATFLLDLGEGTAAPEPTSLALFGASGVFVALMRRRLQRP